MPSGLPSPVTGYIAAIRSLFVIALVCTAMAGATFTGAAEGARAVPDAQPGRITVISDSVMTAVLWNSAPLATLERGFSDVDMQVGICRKLTAPSCPFQGQNVPSLVALVHSLGSQLGQTVVVEVGYNDTPDAFAAAFKQSVKALLAAGAKHIFWVNYHVWQSQFATMNSMLDTLARPYPQVKIVDWAADSALQYSWFQGDGIHLVLGGANALAALINSTVTETLTPLSTPKLPVEHVVVGEPFSVSLAPTGGIAPFAWRVTVRALPPGLHLLADGLLEGVPRSPWRADVHLLVTDADGKDAPMTVSLVSTRSPV